ncbi:MAG: glycosyltransferase [Bacteroidales bacterium]|nr:glycosyltransferase [Bacteroidota bacterium]MBL6949233.1 glycosyltransferase [Bacteroidales bacterium]
MSQSKTIALLSTHGYFDPIPQLGRTDTGGQVVYVLDLAKALSTMGYKVDIFTRWFDKSKKQIDPVPGVENVNVIRIPAGKWEFIPKEFIYDVLPELSKNMIEFIIENNLDYDLFHGHYVDAGIVTIDVANYFGKPSFFTAHSIGAWKRDQMGGDPVKMEKKFNFNHRISEEIRIFKTVNAQTLTSYVQLEKLTELYLDEGYIPGNNIKIIPPGVDVHYYRLPTEKDKQVKTNLPEKYIFCLSRIDSNKGHDLLLHAFDIVRKKNPDVDLVIGGGSPSPKPRELGIVNTMKAIIEEKGMQNRVHIIGYVPDEMMRPYYQQSLFFVLPSLFEPFGMTSQEAMACGKTVVASKYGGIKDVITNHENGFLVDPANAEEFADVMIQLIKDQDLNEKMGLKAHSNILNNYSWEAQARKHNELYNKYQNSPRQEV